MCFGKPQAPQIIYQGPSDADLARSQAALDTYKTQIADSQKIFKDGLQTQNDKANKETGDLKNKYAADTAAAIAAAEKKGTGAQAAALLNQAGYAASATQTEAPAAAQTTAAVIKKDKPKNKLRITPSSTPASAGTGLNIGV
jgi:hypothetical protein